MSRLLDIFCFIRPKIVVPFFKSYRILIQLITFRKMDPNLVIYFKSNTSKSCITDIQPRQISGLYKIFSEFKADRFYSTGRFLLIRTT